MMNNLFIFLTSLCFCLWCKPSFTQEQEIINLLEDMAGKDDLPEGEEEMLIIQRYRERPLSLHTATQEDLSIFPFLGPIQVAQFIRYRAQMGELLDVLELQAIPGWDPDQVRKMLPFVTVERTISISRHLRESLQKGSGQFLLRTGIKAQSGQLLRFQFDAPGLKAGIQTEKDAGEHFWQGNKGIAFASGYLAAFRVGPVRQLVVGDFLVNVGQGLVLGQGRAIKKSSMPLVIKRQQPFLQTYRSTDENRFFRGMGMLISGKHVESGLFFSANRLDGTMQMDSLQKGYISSLLNSGIHRTSTELDRKNNVLLSSVGGMMNWRIRRIHVAMYSVHHYFSIPLIPADRLYNRMVTRGNTRWNSGVSADITQGNMHAFGEWALDREGDPAWLLGAMMALDTRMDMSLLIRKLSRGYRSFFTSAFTEVTEPGNEEGIYMGWVFRISPRLRLDGYADHYRFPWLAYRIDAPGQGRDFMFQLTYRPARETNAYVRFKWEQKSGADLDGPLRAIADGMFRSCRFQWEHIPSREWKVRFRIEFNQSRSSSGEIDHGLLSYAELFWDPEQKPFRLNARCLFGQTTGYASRIYAYENDVLFYAAIPAFFGKTVRVYTNCRWDVNKRCTFSGKLSRNFSVSNAGWDGRIQFLYQFS